MSYAERGVLLAGGEGNRLKNPIYNKHLSWVYDKLMVEYPIQTLGELGCKDVLVVGSSSSVKDMVQVIGDGSEYGLDLSYKVQRDANGAAEALGLARDFMEGEKVFPVILGDCYFDPAPKPDWHKYREPTLFYHRFDGAHNHSVYDPEKKTITEKPVRALGQAAIIGLYFYDQEVFEQIDKLQPTERGELELVDLHNYYLNGGCEMTPYHGFFGDMGTPDGLLRVARHIADRNTPNGQSQAQVRQAYREMYARIARSPRR